ncbi:MAG: response regulator transcription factor [Saprospiraceae bacterium]
MIRIIIYDDHAQRCESLKALISLAEGMECVGYFPDCSHVIEEMKRLQPHVVLMDIEMPHVDGISGVRKIKQAYPQIRIIMQTVFDDEERIFACLQAGAEGYILKNASAEKIIQSIREVFDGGASMTPSVALQVMKYFNHVKGPVDFNLTPREKEVLSLLSGGKSYKMVADKLGISYSTVNGYIKNIYEKLHVHSVTEAVSIAHKNRIV